MTTMTTANLRAFRVEAEAAGDDYAAALAAAALAGDEDARAECAQICAAAQIARAARRADECDPGRGKPAARVRRRRR